MTKNKLLMTLAAVTMLQTSLSADSDQFVEEQLVAMIPDQDQLIAANAILKNSDATATKFKGVYITSKKKDILQKGRPSINGVQFDDFDYTGDEAEIRAIVEPFFGKQLTPQELADLRSALVKYMKKAHPAARVVFPQQNAVNGVIQILISKHILGEVRYKGNEWYSDAYLSRYLHLNSGQEIAEDVLLNDFSWINRNPFQRLTVDYIPSKVPGVMDLEITTKDRLPIRINARAENTGNASTGYVKFATGFSWGNAFGVGDLMTYEYGTSNIEKRVMLHRINYTSFLPWRHVLGLFGNYNVTKPVSIMAESRSVNYGAKLRYTIPFKPLFIPFAQDITFGGDWKHFANKTFSKRNRTTKIKTLNETMLYLAYTTSDTIGKHNFNVSFENYWDPGFNFLNKEGDGDYNRFRMFAKNHFYYFLLTAGYTYYTPMDFAIALLTRTQRSSRTLPSSEQFGIGGYNTVRGYKETVFSADNSFVANLEVRTPSIMTSRTLKDKLIFLGFLDYGFGNNHKANPKSRPTAPKNHVNAHLLGAGGGVRYSINPYITFRCDYGFKLHDLYYTNPVERRQVNGIGRFHMGLLLSY